MRQENRKDLRWVQGAADALELLARAFSFPDIELARALVDGRFADDAASCAADLAISASTKTALDELRMFEGADPEALLSEMRRIFSRLYLVTGRDGTLYPYEGAFKFMAEGRPGEPSVFANRSALDMGRLLKAEGLEPDPERHEPADSIWFELAYLSLLYGRLWQALNEGSGSAVSAGELRGKIEEFQQVHGRPWMMAFMERTQNETQGVYYALASWASAALSCVLGTSDE